MPKKKSKNDKENGAPDIENLIKLIAKTLKENFDPEDITSMANDFGINIKLSTEKIDSSSFRKTGVNPASAMQPVQNPAAPNVMPQPLQNEPFVETIYKKDSVVLEAMLSGTKKADIDVIATKGSIIIEVHKQGAVFSKKISLDAYVDPEKGTATYKNGVLEVSLPIVQVAYMKDFKLNIL